MRRKKAIKSWQRGNGQMEVRLFAMVAPSPYRKVIIDLHKKDLSTKTIVKQLGISRRTVQAAVRRFKTLGSYRD
ncbi:unnamed protein product, partial [Mesorhabditis belari]|uniref:Uncharacterized protein n=1 Tax=Mesorhabditis belari TaxID=2138241 RepID=A0AAF3EMU1_9BILA